MSIIYKFKKDKNPLQPIIITVVMSFILMGFMTNSSHKKPVAPTNMSGIITGYAHIIDGDSLKINGVMIRFHGSDAPELGQPCWRGETQYHCGQTAKKYLTSLVGNKPVTCQTRKKGRYGRIIAKCYNHNGHDIQALMVLNGHAIAYLYYSKDYEIQQNEAKKAKRGIWAGRFTEPYLFRKRSKVRTY